MIAEMLVIMITCQQQPNIRPHLPHPVGALPPSYVLSYRYHSTLRVPLTGQDAMAEEGRVRRKALDERLKAKRHAKEAELDRRGGGERARCDQDADITRLEELEIEVRALVCLGFLS